MLRTKMPLRFCANLNFLFTENNTQILDRYRLARQAGFSGVENGFPSNVTVEQAKAVQEETGLKVILLNICLVAQRSPYIHYRLPMIGSKLSGITLGGSTPGSEFGCAAIPNKEKEFQENLSRTIEFAKALDCKKIHLMAGKINPMDDENYKTYIKNLKYAANILETEKIIGLIEPISTYGVPGYYLNSYDKAIKAIEEVNSDNVKLMLDLYHLQHIRGNIVNTIQDLMKYIGHVQVAQVPGRNEPNTDGEINYGFILNAIETAGYNDWIGCEYKPKSGSVQGLGWIKQYGYVL